jgi:hypothetical protein
MVSHRFKGDGLSESIIGSVIDAEDSMDERRITKSIIDRDQLMTAITKHKNAGGCRARTMSVDCLSEACKGESCERCRKICPLVAVCKFEILR